MAEIVDYGKQVEAAGFDTVWLSEAWRDSLVSLAVYGTPDEVSLVTPSPLLDEGAIKDGYDAILDTFRR